MSTENGEQRESAEVMEKDEETVEKPSEDATEEDNMAESTEDINGEVVTEVSYLS